MYFVGGLIVYFASIDDLDLSYKVDLNPDLVQALVSNKSKGYTSSPSA